MCLECLKEIDVSQKKGLKVVGITHSKAWYPPIKAYMGELGFGISLRCDEWIEDNSDQQIMTGDAQKIYRTGFHIFLESDITAIYAFMKEYEFTDTFKYRLAECEFDDVVATGYQFGVPTVVARKIVVYSNREATPNKEIQ